MLAASNNLAVLAAPYNLAVLAASYNPNTIYFLTDLPRRKSRQQRAYNASALPILYPLKFTGVCGSYEPLMALPQLPKGYKSGSCTTTGRPYYINVYNNKA